MSQQPVDSQLEVAAALVQRVLALGAGVPKSDQLLDVPLRRLQGLDRGFLALPRLLIAASLPFPARLLRCRSLSHVIPPRPAAGHASTKRTSLAACSAAASAGAGAASGGAQDGPAPRRLAILRCSARSSANSWLLLRALASPCMRLKVRASAGLGCCAGPLARCPPAWGCRSTAALACVGRTGAGSTTDAMYSGDRPYLGRQEGVARELSASRPALQHTGPHFSSFSLRSASLAWASMTPAARRSREASRMRGARRHELRLQTHTPPELMMSPPLRTTPGPCFASLSRRTASTSTCRPVKAGAENRQGGHTKKAHRSVSMMRATPLRWRAARTPHAPARDCWPSRRCVWPFSCWMSLPGSTPESEICTHFPMPNFSRASFSANTSSFVHPGLGVKFHRLAASPILGPAPSSMVVCFSARFASRTVRIRGTAGAAVCQGSGEASTSSAENRGVFVTAPPRTQNSSTRETCVSSVGLVAALHHGAAGVRPAQAAPGHGAAAAASLPGALFAARR